MAKAIAASDIVLLFVDAEPIESVTGTGVPLARRRHFSGPHFFYSTSLVENRFVSSFVRSNRMELSSTVANLSGRRGESSLFSRSGDNKNAGLSPADRSGDRLWHC